MASNKVFVVHGRDLLAREAVAHVLQNLGLEAVVLGENVRVGQTWIEGLEAVCDDIAFAVVIYNADDRGALWSEPRIVSPRVRQNVLFELGFMVGKLGRSRVCVLYEDGVEVPSDYVGVKLVKLDSEWDWKLHLTAALKSAGLDVDPNRVINSAPWSAPTDQEIIRNQVERTKRIVKDLRTLAEDDKDLRKQVRFSGFLSPFALGHPEEFSARDDSALLRGEKEALLNLATNGCEVFCIITMPTRIVDDPRVVCWRLRMLLDFLTSDDPALKNTCWSIAPRIENYVYIIGQVSFLQGFKGDDTMRGFALTERRTAPEELYRQAGIFDERFDLYAEMTIKRSGIQRGEDRREDLLRATIKSVNVALEHFSHNARPGFSGYPP